jgi:hypothetical protein
MDQGLKNPGTIGHSVIVGQTRSSYTYTQPLRATGLYPMYHGTQEWLFFVLSP